MTLEVQFLTLTLMFASGFVISIFFDGYRVLKDKIYFPKMVIFFIDVGFGIASALLAFYLLFFINNGQFRVIIVLIFIIGIFVYYLTTSRYIVLFWLKIFYVLSQIFKMFRSITNLIILKPLKFTYKIIILFFTFLISIFYGLFHFAKKYFIKSYSIILIKNRKANNEMNSKTKKAGFVKMLKKIFRRK